MVGGVAGVLGVIHYALIFTYTHKITQNADKNPRDKRQPPYGGIRWAAMLVLVAAALWGRVCAGPTPAVCRLAERTVGGSFLNTLTYALTQRCHPPCRVKTKQGNGRCARDGVVVWRLWSVAQQCNVLMACAV